MSHATPPQHTTARAKSRWVFILPLLLIVLVAVFVFWPRRSDRIDERSQVTPPSTQETSAPETMPTAPPVSFPTPVADLSDYQIYRTVLKPDFGDDVDLVPNAPHYFIEAMLIADEIPLITGIERVRYTNNTGVMLSEIYFRLYPNLPTYGGTLNVNRVLLDGQVISPTLQVENSALRIPLATPLAPGEVADLSLWFQATMPTQVQVGTAGVGVYGFYEGVYDLAGFYPVLAVYDQQGWNLNVSPAFGDATFTESAFYRVQLTMPTAQTVVASGSSLWRRSNGDGTDTWEILAGPIRAFYAASSEDYQVISQEVGGTEINSYYLEGGLTGAETALGFATRSLKVFNELFGEYPYPELDLVAMPTTGFGMEYAGIVAIASEFYGEDGGAFAEAVVHEIAHQWWYNLVGNNQPLDPWLDESLTNYAVYLFYEAVDWPEMQEALMTDLFLFHYQAAQNLGFDRPVTGPVESFDETSYISIVYYKGPLFFHELRLIMGDEAFLTALRDYIQRYRYKIAYPADLLTLFQEHTEEPLDELYSFWLGADLLELLK